MELDIREGPPLSPEKLKEAVKGTDAIISVIPDQINRAVMETAGPSLKLVANYAVGFDNVDLETASKLGIYVSNTPGDLTEAVAEHSLALILALARKIVEADKYTRAGNFKYWEPMIFLGPRIAEKTLGIVGMGRIGQHLAKLAKNGFNMRILYHDLKREEQVERDLGAIYTSVDELLENSDFVSLHVPLLPSTEHMIGLKELRKMKPTAYLINTARGKIVDEESLIKGLQEKWIEGAAIDVFDYEPAISPELKALNNLIMTPHIASATREARIEMARMAAENVIEVLINKRPPVNLVNKDIKNLKEL